MYPGPHYTGHVYPGPHYTILCLQSQLNWTVAGSKHLHLHPQPDRHGGGQVQVSGRHQAAVQQQQQQGDPQDWGRDPRDQHDGRPGHTPVLRSHSLAGQKYQTRSQGWMLGNLVLEKKMGLLNDENYTN